MLGLTLLGDVVPTCWVMLKKIFDGNQTSVNIIQHPPTWWSNECNMGDPALLCDVGPMCWIQHCWMMFKQHVGSNLFLLVGCKGYLRKTISR